MDISHNAPGDYFCSEIKLSPDFGETLSEAKQIEVLLRGLSISFTIFEKAEEFHKKLTVFLPTASKEMRERVRKLSTTG